MKKKNEKMTIDKLAEITQKGFETLESKLENKMDSKINGLRDEMGNKIDGLRDELKGEMSEKFDMVLSGQDQILKRLENLESDNTMDSAVYRRHEDKLENHEKRIAVLENKV